MIDRGDIRHGAPTVAATGFTAGRWLWSVRRRGASTPDNEEAGGTVREIDV